MPTACPDCGGAVEVTRVASQHQEELPRVRPIVRRFDIEVGRCSRCRRRVQGPATASRYPTPSGRLRCSSAPGSPRSSSSCTPRWACRWPRSPVCCGRGSACRVTTGGLVGLLHRIARDATPVYHELCRQVRNAPVVTPDETGWRVDAKPFWLWTFVTPDTTVYSICPGRGFDDAATVLGRRLRRRCSYARRVAGVPVLQGFLASELYQSPATTLPGATAETPLQPPGARRSRPFSRPASTCGDRCRNGELTRHGLASLRGRLEARLGRLIDAAPPLKDAKRFAKHLANEFPAVFLFLRDPSIDATNWRAEQAIRPAVVIRKVCGGNRTRKGADTQQVLSTVVRTRPSAPPRPANADGRDAARPRARHSRGLRASAAARVGPGDSRTAAFRNAPRSRGSAPSRGTRRCGGPAPCSAPMGPEAPGRRFDRPRLTGRRWPRRLSRHAARWVVAIAMKPTRQPSQSPRDSKIPTPSS